MRPTRTVAGDAPGRSTRTVAGDAPGRPTGGAARGLLTRRWLAVAAPLLLIAVAILIRLPLLAAPLTFSSDIWRQADTAAIARHFLHNGFRLFYPQIDWGGTGPGYVETEMQLYPFLVALCYRVFGEHLIIGRIVSLLFAVPTMALLYLLAKRLLGTLPALGALLFFAISPLYVRYSVAFMPESTVLCFYLGALWCFTRWINEPGKPRLRWLLGAALCTALAALVKPTSLHIGLVFLVLLQRHFGRRWLRRWDVWLFGAISLVPAVFFFHHARGLYLTYGNTFGLFSGGDSKFGGLHDWLRPGFYLSLGQLERAWVFTNVGALLFAAGAAVAVRRRHPELLLAGLGSIGIYYLIVARYAQAKWGIQYHVYMLPYAALGVGVAFSWLADHTSRLAGVVLALLALGGIGGKASNLYAEMRYPEPAPLLACAEQVARIVPADAPIIVSTTSRSREGGVLNNYQEPVIFFYSDRHGFSLPADRLAPEQVERLHQAGGRYLVMTSEKLYRENPEFAAYLEAHGEQLGEGVAAGCGVYRLAY